jgi:tetratricopeptide (TPR) repeat protein
VLSEALNTQGLIAGYAGRFEQALALMKHSLELALEHDLTGSALRAYNNLGDLLDRRDRYEEAIETLRPALALARKAGYRMNEWRMLGELGYYLLRTGGWEEAMELAQEMPEERIMNAVSVANTLIEIAVERGDPAEARRILGLLSELEGSADVQDRWGYASLSALTLRSERRFDQALAASDAGLKGLEFFGGGVSADAKIALSEGLESGLALGRFDHVEALLGRIDAIPPGRRPPSMVAQAARYRARLAAARNEHGAVEQGFKTAQAVFREHGLTFFVAATELEHGEWLADQGRREEAEPLLEEAREIFERLAAAPWLERCDRLASTRAATASV